MPISHHKNIFSVLNLVDDLYKKGQVKSILDIGAGFGKYGMLIRERLDIRFKRYRKESWQVEIDCVESYLDYITVIHEYIYNTIYVAKIEDIMGKLKSYDIILMIDCIEHLEKDLGKKVLKRIEELSNKCLILSFPNIYQAKAGADWENPLERHRCLWTKEDVEKVIGPVNKYNYTIYAKYK